MRSFGARKSFLLSSFIFINLFGVEISSPIVEQGSIQSSEELHQSLQIQLSNHDNSSAAYWYGLSQIYIQLHEYNAAIKALHKAIDLDPKFFQAYAQLGYIYLWEGDLVKAESYFNETLKKNSCNPDAINGEEKIANIWRNKKGYKKEAIKLYQKLLTCRENDADYLFLLGVTYSHTGQLKKAEITLKECIRLYPDYIDAKLQLAKIYTWEGKWDLAAELYNQYPDYSEAKKGLARVNSLRGNHKIAQEQYHALLEDEYDDVETRKNLARNYVSQQRYREAAAQYAIIQNTYPDHEINPAEIFDTKSHTRITGILDGDYTVAKENDPNLNAPVVRDYYFNTSLSLLFPIFDQWRIDTKGVLYQQKEDDIYPPTGLNYDVYLSGGQFVSHYFFLKDWKWDVLARVFNGWQNQIGAYPFKDTTRFEPGTSIVYNSERQLFLLDGHYESFITKNFDTFQTNLIEQIYFEGRYGYRFNMHLKPEITGWLNAMIYHDSIHNRRYSENVNLKLDVPFLDRILFISYLFEHSSFKYLTPNYFSYKDQWRNTIEANFHFRFSSRFYWELYYQRQYQLTHQLIQPIGDFLFIAQSQFLVGNKVGSLLTYFLKDAMEINLSGYYFRNTLPYRNWNIKGSFQLQF